MVQCPKVRSMYRRIFFFLLRWSPLGWNQRWRFTRREARWKLEPKMAPVRGDDERLVFSRYSGTFPRPTRGVLKKHQRPQFGRKAKSPRPPSVVDKGAGAVVVLGAPSTCAQCGLQNGPGSQIRGAPLPGPSGEQGLVLDQRMPSVGVELGDRTTTRAKARSKLNRDGKQETCLLLGASFRNRIVLFEPIHVEPGLPGQCLWAPGRYHHAPNPPRIHWGAPEFFWADPSSYDWQC